MSVVETLIFFFFKQKTAYEMRISDWSSDVCSSDLDNILTVAGVFATHATRCSADALACLPLAGEPARALCLFDHPVAAEPEAQRYWQIGRASCRERVCQYV